jgi:hypothetical protein
MFFHFDNGLYFNRLNFDYNAGIKISDFILMLQKSTHSTKTIRKKH